MQKIQVGDIYTVLDSEQMGIVIFEQVMKYATEQNIRIVPIYTDKEHLLMATGRDIIIPSSENPLKQSILAACWNARGMTSRQLSKYRGQVSEKVVKALRTCEITRIISDVDISDCLGWQGVPLRRNNETNVNFQLGEIEKWNQIEDYSVKTSN